MIHFLKERWNMKKEHLSFLSSVFLFEGIDPSAVNEIADSFDFSVKDFSKGDVIFSPESFQKKIGFVLRGECRVEKARDDECAVFLNTLKPPASFGIMAALSQGSEYPTRIIASKSASVMFIGGDDLITIIKKYPEVSLNVIKFLTSRITFLNTKVATFSEKSTLQRLAYYLISRYRECGSTVKISRTTLAAELGIGRASVYRDLDHLSQKKLIDINQKEIIIICPEGLERI